MLNLQWNRNKCNYIKVVGNVLTSLGICFFFLKIILSDSQGSYQEYQELPSHWKELCLRSLTSNDELKMLNYTNYFDLQQVPIIKRDPTFSIVNNFLQHSAEFAVNLNVREFHQDQDWDLQGERDPTLTRSYLLPYCSIIRGTDYDQDGDSNGTYFTKLSTKMDFFNYTDYFDPKQYWYSSWECVFKRLSFESIIELMSTCRTLKQYAVHYFHEERPNFCVFVNNYAPLLHSAEKLLFPWYSFNNSHWPHREQPSFFHLKKLNTDLKQERLSEMLEQSPNLRKLKLGIDVDSDFYFPDGKIL